jgi:hypothetical protein
MEQSVSIVQVIQAMLAPGIMISACGLLLLGMNNKYSLVVNRIRLLNEEKRRFKTKAEEKEFTYNEEVRLKSISIQLEKFKFRVKLVRNAVFFYSLAVGLFVITSLFIGIAFYLQNIKLETFIILFFSLGMIAVLTGVSFAAYETIKGYQIVSFEIKADE